MLRRDLFSENVKCQGVFGTILKSLNDNVNAAYNSLVCFTKL